MRACDLNADMGEFANAEERANEAALMPLITSCSIACGGHAGNEKSMRETIRLAKQHHVSIGAHPSYSDREGFGRRSLSFDPDELLQDLRSQISVLKSILDKEGSVLRHIKPHGALYNDAAANIDLARLVAKITTGATLVGPPNSALHDAAKEAGLAFAAEGFVDRLYQASGALTPRSQPGAVISDIEHRATQGLSLARGEVFETTDGPLRICVETLCIHSDSPGAVETAKAVRCSLEVDGFTIKAFQ